MRKLVLIALAIVSLQAIAQEAKKERPKHRDNAMNMSAEDMAELQTKKMTLHLDLNEKQQKEIYTINLENARARKEQMKARKAKKEAGEKPSQEERKKMMNAMLDHKIAMKQKMKSILNDEQFAKWEKAQAKMDHKRKEGMRPKTHKKGEKMKKE